MPYHRVTSSKTSKPESRQSVHARAPEASAHPLLHLQRQLGNQAITRLIQAKLSVSEPGDPYEQEADRVAAQVVSQLNAPPIGQRLTDNEDPLQPKPLGTLQRQELPDKEKPPQMQPLPLQRQSAADAIAVSPELETQIEQARGSGQALAEAVRTPMEQAFGTDFSHVRIHTDSRAADLSQSLQAKAFTVGQDLFFQQGEYNPGNRTGQALIAHELTHVVQQQAAHSRSNPIPLIQRQVLSKIKTSPFDEDWIDDVIIGGRTPSPFSGTMGAHSTAWIAHIDTIRRQLINTTLSEGIQALIDLSTEECNSPLWAFETMIDERHLKKLQSAKVDLLIKINTAINAVSNIATETTAKVQILQRLINSHLTLVNYLPLATVEGGDPSGHGEGSVRGDLNIFEYVFANVKQAGDDPLPKGFTKELEQLSSKDDYQKLIKSRQFDQSTDNGNKLKQMLIERLWKMFAAETPGVFLQDQGATQNRALKVWYYAIRNFLKTIRTAYPYAYDFTEMQRVENQLIGFNLALQNAHYPLDPALLSKLTSALRGNPISEEAIWREDNDEVAQSDFYQSGTGFQATLLLEGEANRIGSIEMIGRTQSPFSGTMGAHSTAWVVHLDAVRRLLIGKTVVQAIAKLKQKAEQELQDPSLQRSSQISEKHQIYLLRAFDLLKKYVALADAQSAAKPIEQVAFLEEFIKEYLSFINFLPLSTVEVGKIPGGRREGEHRNFLLNYEEYGEKILPPSADKKAILREHIEGLYDPSAASNFPPKLGQREKVNFSDYLGYKFTPEHELFKYVIKPQKPTVTKRDVARGRFYHAIQEAYPRALLDSGLMGQKSEELDKFTIAEKAVLDKEGKDLENLLHQNNCLINAIKKAALGADAQVTPQELLAIRMRIGEFGTMLLASGRVINIICEVLGINRGVVVVYPIGMPSEDFGDTTTNPLMIKHTGYAHFVPYTPDEELGSEGRAKRPAERDGEGDFSKERKP